MKKKLTVQRKITWDLMLFWLLKQIVVFFIQDGKTALFFSTADSNYEDDVRDVLRYLIVEKGIDANSIDKVAFY